MINNYKIKTTSHHFHLKIILAAALILFCSGCRWFSDASTPYLSMLNYKIPDGTPIFQKGYGDGCGSILRNRGTGLFRDRFKYKYDTTLMENPEYQFGFSRGWSNCFNYVVAGRHTLGGSADTYIYGGNWGAPIGMGKGNIDGTVNYESGSWSNPFASGSGIDGAVWGPIQTGKGGSGTVFGGHPLWGTWQTDQLFGQ